MIHISMHNGFLSTPTRRASLRLGSIAPLRILNVSFYCFELTLECAVPIIICSLSLRASYCVIDYFIYIFYSFCLMKPDLFVYLGF